MTTAFVLSGGGSLGAVQVGMLQALHARGIEPDVVIGTSAGAMNAAWVAGHGTSDQSLAGLAAVWSGLRRRDVFPVELPTVVRGLLGHSRGVVSPARLERLVTACAGIATLDEAVVPVHLVTADLLTGRAVPISTGPVTSGVLASAAVPGVFPPVTRAGRHLVDGGVADRTGVTHAVRLGATTIYVLPTGTPCALPGPPASAIGTALHALTLLIQQRLAHDVANHRAAATIKVLPPLCPLDVSAVDFGHGGSLVTRAREVSTSWIERGGIDLPAAGRFLDPHRHLPRGLPDRTAGPADASAGTAERATDP